jgi:hypothetical protein
VELALAESIPGDADHKPEPQAYVAIRDSKNPDGPKLYFTRAEWSAFLDALNEDNERLR